MSDIRRISAGPISRHNRIDTEMSDTPTSSPSELTPGSVVGSVRRIKTTMGNLEKEWKCKCGVKSHTGALFEDDEPIFFCMTCVMAGKPREKYQQVDAEKGKPGTIMAECFSCGAKAPVKFGISIGAGIARNFCEKCYNSGKATVGSEPRCVLCTQRADPRYTHQVTFVNLLHQPILCKTTCSIQHYAAVSKFAEESQEGTLKTLCICGKDITGNGSIRRLRCARCKSVFYCSRECQKTHWKIHKHMCQDVASIPRVDVNNPEETTAAARAAGLSIETEPFSATSTSTVTPAAMTSAETSK